MKIGMAWLPNGQYVENYKIQFCFSSPLDSQIIYFLNCISPLINSLGKPCLGQSTLSALSYKMIFWFVGTIKNDIEKKHVPSAFSSVFHVAGFFHSLASLFLPNAGQRVEVILWVIWQMAMPLQDSLILLMIRLF